MWSLYKQRRRRGDRVCDYGRGHNYSACAFCGVAVPGNGAMTTRLIDRLIQARRRAVCWWQGHSRYEPGLPTIHCLRCGCRLYPPTKGSE